MNLLEDVKYAGGARSMAVEYSSSPTASAESRKLCVYNQTRECFLGLDVTRADLSVTDLGHLITKLALKCGEGLWMEPFRGIPETGTILPLDLIYLDSERRVIDVVESFPTFRLTPMSKHPASVLALPTHSIYSSQTQPGDRLLLCAAEEIEQHLKLFGDSNAAATPDLIAALVREMPLWAGGPGLVQMKDRSAEQHRIAEQTHEMGLVEPDKRDFRAPRSWLERWWSPDPRRAPRQSASDVAAYYWNGGAPQPRNVKDISSTGLYLVTEERWYPGTLILMTLQPKDGGASDTERAIAVHSRAMRWGNDGVGLQFILRGQESSINGNGQVVEGVDRKQLDRFLRQLGKGK